MGFGIVLLLVGGLLLAVLLQGPEGFSQFVLVGVLVLALSQLVPAQALAFFEHGGLTGSTPLGATHSVVPRPYPSYRRALWDMLLALGGPYVGEQGPGAPASGSGRGPVP